MHRLRQVSAGDGGGQALGFVQRLADALHVGQRGGDHDQCRQRHRHAEDEQGLGADVFLVLLQRGGLHLEHFFNALEVAQDAGVLLMCAREHAVGHGGRVVAVVGQLANHRLRRFAVRGELLLHLAHDGGIATLIAHQHVVHLLQGDVARTLPLGLGLEHGLGLFVADDHVFLIATHVAQRYLKAGQGERLLEGVIHKLHAEFVQSAHAPQAGATDHAQQDQNDADGTHHSGSDGELAHHGLHGRKSSLS
ncbi:hypothetical protein FQZ97_840450 [compost metagenome]